jgi:hypothetical protein
MRWLIIFFLDIVLFAAIAVVLWTVPSHPVLWIVIAFALLTWLDSGGSFAWSKRWHGKKD